MESHHVEGYEKFREFMKTVDPKKDTYVMFCGTKLPSGENWCHDCEKAKPFVQEALKKYGNENLVYIYVEVGDREFWKSPNNPFAKDKLQILVIPTIMKWGTPKRLFGGHCVKPELLELLFTDE